MNMNTTIDQGITAEQLKALRNADTIVFRYSPEATTIEAVRSVDPSDGYGERDLRVSIPVEDAVVTNYACQNPVDGSLFRTVSSAAWVLGASQYNATVSTFLRQILRKGDRIRPVFVAGNDSAAVRDAKLTVDELHVNLDRGQGRALTFSLDHWVGRPLAASRAISFEA